MNAGHVKSGVQLFDLRQRPTAVVFLIPVTVLSFQVVPALLIYKAGELLGNFLSVTKHFSEEFFATEVEAFLNEYGLLPEKEFAACADDADESEDVE